MDVSDDLPPVLDNSNNDNDPLVRVMTTDDDDDAYEPGPEQK